MRFLQPLWQFVALAYCITATLILGACGSSPRTTLGNEVEVGRYFPASLIAEPIKLREGHIHTTLPFGIKGPEQSWGVELGFIRHDQHLTRAQRREGNSVICWSDSPVKNEFDRGFWGCKVPSPGLNVQWELLKLDGTTAAKYSYDGLLQQAGGTHSADAVTTTLSGFRNLPAGMYRLRVTVLRDFPQLDTAKPHVLVSKPFFRKII